MFAGKKSAQIREILISESAWEEMTCLFAPSLGLSLRDCMAFGDAMNDREMLGSVGSGFIMGNAMPQLRAELPHLPVIGHCRNQAVSHYLTHWLDYPHLPYSPE
ncbi:hypothetical protein ESCOCK403M_15645 [Escherichia coli]